LLARAVSPWAAEPLFQMYYGKVATRKTLWALKSPGVFVVGAVFGSVTGTLALVFVVAGAVAAVPAITVVFRGHTLLYKY